MKKKIVICSDGTGNTGGKGYDTNVWRIYTATAGKEAEQQYAIYDDGVGTEYPWLKNTLQRIFGYGVANNIRELYRGLCHVYEPGAHIYLFGFSRGAHTVRRLVAFISTQGILNPAKYSSDSELERDIEFLYDGYRFQDYHRSERSLELLFFKKNLKKSENNGESAYFLDVVQRRVEEIRGNGKLFKANVAKYWKDYHEDSRQSLSASKIDALDLEPDYRVGIRFMGLWDTVDTVGFPVEWLTDFWNEFVYRFQFRDYRISPFVSCALHALSIDDCRKSFTPRLIDVTDQYVSSQKALPKEYTASVHRDRVTQIWFAGVHSNVGGGYPKQGLAHISLCWIADAAKEHGMIVDDDVVMTISNNQFLTRTNKLYSTLSNPHDKIYNSRSGIWRFYAYRYRDIDSLHQRYCGSEIQPIIDSSVLARIARRTHNYSPFNLPKNFIYFDSCQTNPCGFFYDDEVSELVEDDAEFQIRKEWSKVRDDESNSIKLLAEKKSRILTVSKLAVLLWILMGIFTSIFSGVLAEYLMTGKYVIAVFSMRSSFFWWLIMTGILVWIHRAIDKGTNKQIERSTSRVWSHCIHNVHRQLDEIRKKNTRKTANNV